ncbi:hypothetical protein AVEN_86642-1, partial [Araneus ventricosus]
MVSVENRNREASGGPSFSTTEISAVRIEEMVQNDRLVRAITSELGLSYGIAQCIVSDMLRFSK